MNVEFAELEGKKIHSTAKYVNAAMLWIKKTTTHAFLKS